MIYRDRAAIATGVLLIVLGLVVTSPGAMVRVLPESSYYWGRTYYDLETSEGGFLRGRIDFAVYDTQAEGYDDEFTGQEDGFPNPGTGQYIYAYQVVNDTDHSDRAVAYFGLLDVDDDTAHNTGSHDDGHGGIAPVDSDPPPECEWYWSDEANGFIFAGEHSTFLVFSSNRPWKPGSYEIKSSEDDDLPIPVPEPVTVALLGLGGMFAFLGSKGKKYVR